MHHVYLFFIIKDIDLSVSLSPSPERIKMFDMTSPSLSESFQLMVNWPEEVAKHWTVLAIPFDRTVC